MLCRQFLVCFALGLTSVADAQVTPEPNVPPVATNVPLVERLDDKALGDFIRTSMEQTNYSGTVLVARNGKPVISAALGLADRERKLAITNDTRFRVGSMNKMITATAVMQLIQAGKIKLDAPIGDYIKNYPNNDFARTVTVRHLLTHTGGAGDFFDPQYFAKRLEMKTLNDYVTLYGARAPEFSPGLTFRYSNYGFILLGRIVEEVSGETYYDYVQNHIFAPAGMTRTGFEPENATVKNSAVGYTVQADGYRSNADTLPYRGTSAGGAYSTTADLLAFASALTSYRLLDAAHTRLLTTSQINARDAFGFSGYALGFEEYSTSEMRMFGHRGGAPGMNGDLRIIGDGQAVVVALTNVSPPARAEMLTSDIVKRIIVRKPNGQAADLSH